ncbi:hypothetical protein CAPTEDRAFT_225002 [Capitella teleta]|uniref:Ephrin RBD domain-containing protein n=1 Tax=Capitella teleta TaxID=283909 RepID=R7V734_CAPTE|nr:hypothetical protein CAPTEDRAFT_225002 [Capitella teleta]|eukprot:ELU12166.1 hypothetical protein CAPTEDRAFT_225002 [Capitella teleta]
MRFINHSLRFKASNNDHVIEVNLYDDIDFVCPHFEDDDSGNYEEYYLIHQVSKREYDDCNLYSPDTAIMIVNCSSPGKKKRFTILFEPFQSIPNVPEYHPGGRYYFISTSTGGREGIANPHQGACVYKNMKLTIQVCCESTTPPPPANSTLAIPSTDSTPHPSVVPGNANTSSDLSTTTPKITSTPPPSPPSTTLKDPKDPQGSSNPKFKTTVTPYRSKPPDRTKDPDDEKRENEIDDPEHHKSINRASDSRVPQTLLCASLTFSAVLRYLLGR